MQRPNGYRSRTNRQLTIEAFEQRRVFALDPTGIEQESMQLVNRFRTDPTHEFFRLIASVSPRQAFDSDVNNALTFFNTNVSVLQTQLAALTPVAPVAWDEIAQRVAMEYLPFMAAAKSQSHELNGTLQERFGRYPFDVSRGIAAGENLYQNAFSPIQAHASYVIEWGNGPNGMQGVGHRTTLMNGNLKTAGIAYMSVAYEPQNAFGPMLNVQDLVGLGVTKPMVTGAIFEDRNRSSWYEAGEGIAGVQLTFDGTAGQFTFNAMTAGGYNAEVPAGTYTVTASGAGLKFPITKTNVVVGSQNVWLNFIYDPANVPSDVYESNNTPETATLLSGNDQTLSGGTLTAGDVDYFRLNSVTAGLLNLNLQFPASNGNLDLRMLDAAGTVIGLANTSLSQESLSVSVAAGRVYYVVVESPTRGIGGSYSLQIDTPAAQAAEGRSDTATTSVDDAAILLDVLANDRDPDGDLARSQLTVVTAARGTVAVVNNGVRPALRYSPVAGFSGMDRFSYQITDQQGLTSLATSVEVMVLDFASPLPFLNTASPLDVNADGLVTAIDALLIINQLNLRTSLLPKSIGASRAIFGYLDVNGNGSVEPLDVLLVINSLNARGAGEGESNADLEREDDRASREIDASDLFSDGFKRRPGWLAK